MDQSAETTTSNSPLWRRFAGSVYGLIAGYAALIWLIELLDMLSGSRLDNNGIQPRSLRGLDGILWAPFLHSNVFHVLSNTFPLVILGGLVAIRGKTRWLQVTVTTMLVGGTLTWLFARDGNHIGASGVVFGYLGALVGAAVFERRLVSIAPAVVAIFLYGSMLLGGLIPKGGISWEGHLTGLLGGLAAAWWLSKSTDKPATPTQDPLPWETDGPLI